MKTFPNAWVLPGGKLDPNESIKDCAIRETQEEVGITCSPDKVFPFIMFESVSRINLKAILIVFFYAKIELNSQDVELKLSEDEVSEFLWLDKS